MARALAVAAFLALIADAGALVQPSRRATRAPPLRRLSMARENGGGSGRGPIIFAVGAVGAGWLVFESVVLPVQNIARTASRDQQVASKVGRSDLKGAFGSLTKREVNDKLAALPVFYVANEEGVPTLQRAADDPSVSGEGLFFMDPNDAKAHLSKLSKSSSSPLKVEAATVDEVYFTLVKRSAKLGSFLRGVSGKADALGRYLLVPSPSDVGLADVSSSGWSDAHARGDVPLFRVKKLAFARDGGTQIPLFTHKEDALEAYRRLREQQPAGLEDRPEIEVLSLDEVVERMLRGAAPNNRETEFFPAVESLREGRKMLGLDPI